MNLGRIALIGWLVVIIVVAALFLFPTKQATPSSNSQIKLSLTFDKTPEVNTETALKVKVLATSDSPNTKVNIVLPEGIELINGEQSWSGSLKANKPVEFTAQIKIKKIDNSIIVASVGNQESKNSTEISFPIEQIPINVSEGVGGIAKSYNNETRECEEDRHCKETQYCDEKYTCQDVPCTAYCSRVINHQCLPYECCTNEECEQDYLCIDHECRKPIFNSTNKIAFLSNNTVFTVDKSGVGEAKLTSIDGFGEFRPTWSYDSKMLAMGNNLLFVINADGTNKTYFAKGHDPVWMLDGRVLYVSEEIPRGIIAINISSGEKEVLNNFSYANYLSLSPDGKMIAYSRTADYRRFLHIANINGTGETEIGEGYAPSWSPDGTKLSYANNGIYIVDIQTKESEFIAQGSSPSWSPKGDKIAFTMPQGGISTINTNGTEQLNLTSFGEWPSWSPIQS